MTPRPPLLRRHGRVLRARAGMTLMEVMVAITLTGMMSAAGYGAFTSLIDHRRALREATERLERAAALREMLDGWLANARIAQQVGGVPAGRAGSVQAGRALLAGRDGNTQSSATSAGPERELTFFTTSLTPSLAPNTRVRLYIDADESTPERGLAMEYQAGPLTAGIQRRGLDSTITRMLVEFLDNRTHRWVRGGETTTEGVQTIAVRVTLSTDDPGRSDSLPSVLRLPIVRSTNDPAGFRGIVPQPGPR
jgi:prepilin-type N-terminal cleavage/methylation domain-containing protein